jgi:hypothetical protein
MFLVRAYWKALKCSATLPLLENSEFMISLEVYFPTTLASLSPLNVQSASERMVRRGTKVAVSPNQEAVALTSP